MCGINGFNFKDESKIIQMNEKLKHRGPDGQGFFSEENLSMGHTRLSIIDVAKSGSQPMFYSKQNAGCSKDFNSENIKNSKLSITYNGEIYNYIEVKKELEDFGYIFSTNSDTEVILAAYDKWGKECVSRFNGMWAFSIHDKNKDILFCSRDRFGVKPFYYFHNKDKFVFSSELKSILTHDNLKINKEENINKDSLSLYISNDFIPAPMTIYKNVFKLEAGNNLVLDLSGNKVETERYYFLPKYKPSLDKKESVREIRRILSDATKLRMRSDVEVGSFLSGGVDSTTVVSEMKKNGSGDNVNTFSIGFDGKYDETKFVKIATNSIKTKHHHDYFTKENFSEISNKFSEVYDEPFGSSSGFPTYLVSKNASKEITVCLSGDGGDEIFGGYNLHGIGRKMDLIYKVPRFLRVMVSKIPVSPKKRKYSISSFVKAFKTSLFPKHLFFEKISDWYLYSSDTVTSWKSEKLKECLDISNNSLAEALRVFDLKFGTMGDNFLTKVDRASMASSLEVRSPFLDYRFAELSQKIPTSLKVNFSGQKDILKESLKGEVPDEILYRKKQGFTPPVLDWINEDRYKDKIHDGFLFVNEFIPDFKEVYDLSIKDKKTKEASSYKVRLYILSLWKDRWLTH